jgi:hypothetical protein
MNEVSAMGAKREWTLEERERWWKENIDSLGCCDEELSSQEKQDLKQAQDRYERGEVTPWEDVVKEMGQNTDGTKNL